MLSITDQNGSAITDENHIANLNPFRYRSYYMDTETGMYYLMSRYYDPVTHRFLNADGYFQTGTGISDVNMHAYCNNNPINRVDDDGQFWNIVGGAILGGLVSAGLEVASQLITGTGVDNIDWGSVAIEAITGAATGALISTGLPAPKIMMGRTIVNTANSLAHTSSDGNDMVAASKNAAGAIIGSLASYGMTKITAKFFNNTYSDSLLSSSRRQIKLSYQPNYRYTDNHKKAISKSLTSSVVDTVKRVKNNIVQQIGRTKYKVCPTCGCPHIIIR